MDAVAELLEIERSREARRTRRNRWLVALLVVVVLVGAFAAWGITSQRAADERFDRIQRISQIDR